MAERKSPPMPSRAQFVFAIAVLATALAIASAAFFFYAPGGKGSGTALIGGPFALTDQNGKRVTEKDFLGKYALIFFGYTYCPDICPTELQVMSAALDQMGPKADAIQPVFITIDPARDTPEVLKSYVENFHPRMMGLTGTPEDVAGVARAYRVYYSRAAGGDGANYLMDHSSILYLMGPDGKYLKHFTYMTDAKRLASELDAALAR